VAVVACIALGALLEATIFRIAIFDPVDFVNQSVGACLAGAALTGPALPRPVVPAVLGVAFVFLVLGFVYAFA